ncbi:MAG: hypothetical protein ACREPF_00175 [Rhodanobacteraceae bacterium]
MQSTHPDPSKHSGGPDRADQHPEHAPQQRPPRQAPGRERHDGDRDPANAGHGQQHEVRKPPNRR